MSRTEIMQRLRDKVAAGTPVIGGGAGTGLSAKCGEAAGLDFLVVYNSGRYRMAGRSSMAGLMPYGDANAIVLEMAGEIVPVVEHTPVLAGVCGTDPFRVMRPFLHRIRDAGFSGVQNYPTVCLYDGIIRSNLEETGLGFDREVEMVAEARAQGLLTVTYVHTPAEAEQMAEAGADVVVAHMGLTTSGMIGARTAIGLDEAARSCAAIADGARGVRRDVLVVCHGGPIAEPEDAAQILSRVPAICGFLGASSMERLPTERATTAHMRRFTEIGLSGAGGAG